MISARRHLQTWCDEQRQFLADVDHWNLTHPRQEPLDYRDIRAMVAEAEAMLARDQGHGPIAPFLESELKRVNR